MSHKDKRKKPQNLPSDHPYFSIQTSNKNKTHGLHNLVHVQAFKKTFLKQSIQYRTIKSVQDK